MPTADGRFRGISVPARAWNRVFCRHERWAFAHDRCEDCGVTALELLNRDNRPAD